MDIWFIADTHWGHDRIINFENRPFATTEQMDETMIQKWNSVVKPNDKVYHLGDVFICEVTKRKPIMDRLNGIKYLVSGNHDTRTTKTKWKELGFQEIVTNKPNQFYVFQDGMSSFSLSHIPLDETGYKNVHGHVHSKIHHLDQTKHKCVSVELINYTPIHLDEITNWIKEVNC